MSGSDTSDYIRGSESDSGLKLEMRCPACRRSHKVALTRLDGRFAFTCRGLSLTGQVDDWAAFKANAKEKEAGGDPHVRGS